MVVTAIVAIVSTAVTLRCTAPDYGGALSCAPSDTRILPVNRYFCQGLKVTEKYDYGDINISLLILSSPPKLTGHEKFSFSEIFSFSDQPYWGPGEEHSYDYYMYKGSSFTVSACISDGESDSSSSFSLYKGNTYVDSQEIDEQCGNGQNFSYTYHVKDEDYYWLVFSVQRTHVFESAQLKVYAEFNRTRYEVSSIDSISHFCLFSGSEHDSCSVSVPFSGNLTVLLTLSPGYGVNWAEDGVKLNFTCVPRDWMYAVIVLAVFISLASIIVTILVCLFVEIEHTCEEPSVASNRSNNHTFIAIIIYRIRIRRSYQKINE